MERPWSTKRRSPLVMTAGESIMLSTSRSSAESCRRNIAQATEDIHMQGMWTLSTPATSIHGKSGQRVRRGGAMLSKTISWPIPRAAEFNSAVRVGSSGTTQEIVVVEGTCALTAAPALDGRIAML